MKRPQSTFSPHFNTKSPPIAAPSLGRECLDGDCSVSTKRHPRDSLSRVRLLGGTTRGGLDQLPGLSVCHQQRTLRACVLGKILPARFACSSVGICFVPLRALLHLEQSLATRLIPLHFRPIRWWHLVFLSRFTLRSAYSLSPDSTLAMHKLLSPALVASSTTPCLRQPPFT